MKPSLYQTRSGVFALATLCCILWGSAYPAIKNGYALLHIAPSDIASQMLFAGWRFALAGAILLMVATAMKKQILALSRRQMGQVALLGLTQTAIQYVFFYIGLAHASGVKSSIMNATGVFFSVVLAHFIYANDRLSARKLLGCAVGFLGVVVVNLGGGALGFDFSLLGEGFVIIAAFVLAAASIYGKRLSASMDPMVMTGWQLLVGGLILTGVGMAGGGRLEGFNPQSGALLLYMALLSSVAFAVWSLLLKHNPVGMIAAFNFLVPVFGVALSAIFLGESLLRWSYLAALALVCGGIWLVTRPPAPARA
ncbi:drug/metabolite transporter (DMT)-like permease [Brevundimonas bullata]|uniref:Drug/metabolite transporter (DMT)-like permease n=1 Tax=Brevundimonas bullata TaxID=13160 RepID=A0A7W7INV2_9CAUL|nr:DMT family transporter [Brevundimonas bullata]MBB4797799.1 drug/metabolite transporter (DMT)-like permease [Brevundimonas bullata]MBB6382758.1 drug/metabolite transporter (DMT)-like permease [Brevundimonas bullata]